MTILKQLRRLFTYILCLVVVLEHLPMMTPTQQWAVVVGLIIWGVLELLDEYHDIVEEYFTEKELENEQND